MPRPESASEPMTTRSVSPGTRWARAIIDRDERLTGRHGHEPLARAHREVAGERSGDGEGERRAMSSSARVALAVVELVLQEQRRDDEAAHVGEVREELRAERERELRLRR